MLSSATLCHRSLEIVIATQIKPVKIIEVTGPEVRGDVGQIVFQCFFFLHFLDGLCVRLNLYN